MRLLAPILLLLLLLARPARAEEEMMDRVSDALRFSTDHNRLRGKVSGAVDLETYYLEQPSPGLVFTDGHLLFNPRLSVFVDTRWGEHLYGFVQARVDRGFDPHTDPAQFRWDEYAIRFSPGTDKSLVFEMGKFATTVGSWVNRHSSWENPFVSAPLPYEKVTAISDITAPATPTDFGPPEADEKTSTTPSSGGRATPRA